MLSIQRCEIPSDSLLDKYCDQHAYVDCFCTAVAHEVTFPAFVFAFYTTMLFKLERWILKWTVSRPSTDDDARDLATGLGNTFAAWHVEARTENEMLMCDLMGRTRSWLMIVPVAHSETMLYFGSAVVPVRNPKTGGWSLGFIFQSLLGFHQMYSVLLLYSAKRSIMRPGASINIKNGDSL